MWGAELALTVKTFLSHCRFAHIEYSFFSCQTLAQFYRATATRTEDLVACTDVT